jgi:hypothetical protein
MTTSRASERPERVYSLIVNQQIESPEVLTIDLGSKEILPVFSWAEEARMFLALGDVEENVWRVAELTFGDLASTLTEGSYAGVGFVALDPLPEMVDLRLGTTIALVTLSRQDFLNHLARKRGISRAGEDDAGRRLHTSAHSRLSVTDAG